MILELMKVKDEYHLLFSLKDEKIWPKKTTSKGLLGRLLRRWPRGDEGRGGGGGGVRRSNPPLSQTISSTLITLPIDKGL